MPRIKYALTNRSVNRLGTTLHFDYSIIVSVIGLVVAGSVAYLAYVRPPNIASVLGPKVMLYYRDFGREKGKQTFGLLLPVAFLNTAMKTGLVLSAWLLVYREDTPQERYCMEWQQFGELDGDKWIFKEEAHAIAVPGNSSVARTICFYWYSSSGPKLVLREGVYNIALCFRVERHGQLKMKAKTHKMHISSSQYRTLERLRAAGSSTTVYARLDVELQVNQLMTESESKQLLGLAS